MTNLSSTNSVVQNRLLIVIAVMSASLMQVIDTTIVNVALPHMQGSLGTTSDQISWTLTSYLVSSAIFMPLTGYFSDILGRKKYLLLCICGFTLASAFCGAAHSLAQMVTFRLTQGVFGAALVPLSQSILLDIFSIEEQPKAMAIWGIGVMVGPVLGPTIGGYLTDILTWRWTFYVNIPVGILALFLAWQVVPETKKRKRSMDWLSLAFISLAIGSLQYLLDRGNQDDWFSSYNIKFAAVFVVVGIIGFLYHSIRKQKKKSEEKVFDLHIFRSRNFTIASLLLAVIGLGLYGVMVVQPLFLENLLNYPALTAGLAMAPRGLCSMVSMIFVSKLMKHIRPQILILTGLILNIAGIYFCTHFSQNIDIWSFIWPTLLQGFGLGLIFVPLAVIAFSTLPNSLKNEATGLYSLIRTIGSSIGISVTLTVFTRNLQISWHQLSQFISPYNSNMLNYLNRAHLTMHSKTLVPVLSSVMNQQVQTLSFINVYGFIMWCFVFTLPLIFLIKTPKTNGGNRAGG